MARKYVSALTAGLTPDNWQEKINVKDLSLEEVTDLLGDFKEMEKFGKKLAGYFKEVAVAKLPDGETEFIGHNFMFTLMERSRAGGLDKILIMEEMGAEWVEDHCKEATEYTELRLNRVEVD